MAKKLCTYDNETGEIEELAGIDLLNGFSALKKISIKDAVNKYLNNCTAFKSEKQQEIEKSYFNKFLDQISESKKNYINEINLEDIELFRSTLLKTMKPTSAKRRLTTFHHFFNKCILWNHLYKNPFIGLENIKSEKNHYKPWSLDVFKKFIKLTSGDSEHMFKFLWLTGCRPSELINLKWTDIDYDQKIIKLTCGKNAHISRKFPMSDDVEKLLHTIPFNAESVFRINGKSFKNDNIYQMAKHRLKRLGFDNLTVYGIRHSFASRMSDAGLNAFQIQYLMGHSDIKTTLNYIHENKKVLIDEMNRVNSYHTY